MLKGNLIIDDDTSERATIIQISSARHEILFERIRALTHLSLIVTKAYVSCKGGWFMCGCRAEDKDGIFDHLYKASFLSLKFC
ncbi:ACT domain-containing protein ACR4 [Beta vulgaris subsp. vulgaris]|uniref:ACT domain-containing protein ACR4 n=1 Tax=Beta vulgaris subsp. vulgaris TaxID=3555 RepID=UPI000900552F|nr:ACT domain-containing protein ACR4 [Beta vulgaris subsp. vulgaris]